MYVDLYIFFLVIHVTFFHFNIFYWIPDILVGLLLSC